MFRHILRSRSLLILGIAETVSGMGSWITTLAVFSLLVFRGGGTVAQSTGVFVAALLPMLLLSPVAGWLLDRADRRRLMVASELLAGVTVSGLIFTRNLWVIYGLLALQSGFNSLMTPARQAVVPDLVPQEELTQANAFLQQLAGLVKVTAPILGGALLAVLNPHSAIVLDVISYAVSAAVLLRLPALPPPSVHTPRAAHSSTHSSSPRGAGGLLSALAELPRLRLLFIGVFMTTLIIIGFDVLSSIFTRDVLKGDESLFGLLIGLVGLGTVVSSAWLMVARRQRNLWRDVIMGLFLLALLPALAGVGAWLGSAAFARVSMGLGALIAGAGIGLVHVQSGTLLQTLAPAALLGRAAGVFQSTAVAGQMVGLLITPLVVPAVLSAGGYLALSGLALVLVAAYMAITVRRTRAAPSPNPEWVTQTS